MWLSLGHDYDSMLEIMDLYNRMILSTLNIISHDFALLWVSSKASYQWRFIPYL